MSGVIEDQKKLLDYDDYPSFEITENSFRFLLNKQQINFFSYIEELEERKNILISLIEKPIIDSDSLLFLDQFKDLHESDDLEKLTLKKSEAQELLKKYKNINKYVTTINTNNFTNLEEFIKIIGRKIKILTLKNQAKTYKNYLENQNLYTDIFNKNPRRITEIENCFSTYQETLSEFEILGDKPNDTEVIIKKKMLYRKNERC